MRHYTCDRCRKLIDDQSLRYVVKMEIQVEFEEVDSEPVGESPLAQMQEILEDLGEEAGEDLMDEVYRQHRFDLCDDCFHQYKDDPLGCNLVQPVRFSRN